MNRKYELVYVASPEATDEQVADLHTQVEAIVRTGRFDPPAPTPQVDPPNGAVAATPLPEVPKTVPPKILPGLGSGAPAPA